MVQQLIEFVPDTAPASACVLLLAGAGVGAVLWSAGARMSRYVVALLTVLLGATIGMRMPAWFDWSISGAGPAVGAALVLGVSGFALHGAWMGVLLGLVVALWSGVAVWITSSDAQPMVWPVVHEFTTLASFCQDWWYALPPGVSRLLPYTTAVSLVSGLACAILWTRLTTVAAWSLTGATMLLGGVIGAIELSRPHWLDQTLPHTGVQVALFALLVLLGAGIQWKLTSTPAAKESSTAKGQRRREPADEMECS